MNKVIENTYKNEKLFYAHGSEKSTPSKAIYKVNVIPL